MKWRRSIIVMALAFLFGMTGLGTTLAALPSEPVVYHWWDDPRPAQGTVDPSIIVTAPAELANLELVPPPTVAATALGTHQYRAFTDYNSNVGFTLYANGTNSHGMLVAMSVMGGLSLTKPGSSNHVAVNTLMSVYGGCLYAYFSHTSPAGQTTTDHYFIVANACTSTGTYYTVNSTTWNKYITQGNVTSITDIGVQITDKYSSIRVYESNASNHTWSVDVWNVNTGAYDNFGTYTQQYFSDANVTEFIHTGDPAVNGSYCPNLGTWNITNLFGWNKWTGSAWTPYVTADIQNPASYVNGSPCLNLSGGNSSWYYASTGWTAPGAGPAWSVCGPNKTECRP